MTTAPAPHTWAPNTAQGSQACRHCGAHRLSPWHASTVEPVEGCEQCEAVGAVCVECLVDELTTTTTTTERNAR